MLSVYKEPSIRFMEDIKIVEELKKLALMIAQFARRHLKTLIDYNVIINFAETVCNRFSDFLWETAVFFLSNVLM